MILETASDIIQLSVTVTNAWEKGPRPSWVLLFLLGCVSFRLLARQHVAVGARDKVEIIHLSESKREEKKLEPPLISMESFPS